MKLGIVGLPNVGKSTLFNSLTKAGALSANYPFATIDPNVGIVSVPDERIVKLGELYHTKKVTPATIEFVDIAGLVKGASKGEGLGNQFLANIREVDAIVHVVRCFEDTNIIHVDGSVDPARDIETINLELIFSDVEILDRRIAKIAKQARMDKTLAKELELVEAVKAHLEDGKMARTFEVPDDEDAQLWFKGYNLLTAKPTIYAANVSEDDLADDGASNPHVAKVREMAKEEGAEVFVICAQIEQELADLDEDEKKEYLEDLGVESSGLDKLVAASYSLLGLISFLTAGEDECRAWTIKKGTKAPQAAGKIHTDFERGFIKAEVVNYQDLLDNGSLAAAREKGVKLFLSSTFLYRDEAAYIKKACDAAKQGKLNYIYHIGQYLPNWHPWEDYRKVFYANPRTNGCREIMAIDMPWILDIFGPVKKFSAMKSKNTDLDIAFNDNVYIMMEHENGNKGVFVCDVVTPKTERDFEVYGENFFLSWDGSATGIREWHADPTAENPNKVELTSVDIYGNNAENRSEYASFVVENAYLNEIKAFFAYVKEGKEPVYTFEKDKILLDMISEVEK